LNKVILNQARQQQMLEEICKQLKPNNDESMCDDDVILEGFPIDSLARLNEVNTTLKTDKSYLKKLVIILQLNFIIINLIIFIDNFIYRSKSLDNFMARAYR